VREGDDVIDCLMLALLFIACIAGGRYLRWVFEAVG
jgi:hypothetical protein